MFIFGTRCNDACWETEKEASNTETPDSCEDPKDDPCNDPKKDEAADPACDPGDSCTVSDDDPCKDDNVLTGGRGRDALEGSDGSDIVFGGGGKDTIHAADGNDLIFGGRGKDSINAGAGNDMVFGGRGADSIDGGVGGDLIFGGNGKDTILAGAGTDTVFGGNGADRMVYVVGESDPCDFDYFDGGRGRDTLELVATQAELQESGLALEIQAFEQWLDAGGDGYFWFASLNLKVQDFERLIVTVTGEGNTPPDVVPLNETFGEDAPLRTFDLLTGASDADGDALSVEGLPDEITTREGRVLVAGTDFETTGGRFTLTDAGRAMFNGLAEGGDDEIVVAFQVSDGTASVANPSR